MSLKIPNTPEEADQLNFDFSKKNWNKKNLIKKN